MAKRTKVPKHIAGFKIPKHIRRDFKPLVKILARPEVQALAGTAIAAGAAALAEQSSALGKGKWTAKKVKRRFRFFAAEGQDRASEVAQSIGRAVGSALAAHLPSRRHGENPGAPVTL